ncbi:acid protease [Phellopilus nigrolimitatus]|nr:acid protease [Phellopilus nigrolimitatus]
MKSSCLSVLFACALCSEALRIPFEQSRKKLLQRRSFGKAVSKPVINAVDSDSDDVDLSTVNDLIYMANVTVGGSGVYIRSWKGPRLTSFKEHVVQLDTGSSDLWIKPSSFPLSNVSHTNTQYNLTYGIGWAYGNITTAEVEFAGIKVPKQAFLDVNTATNPALSYGAEGILGLGFTSLSTIDSVVNGTGGDWGRSVLYNAFLDNPTEKNYITFALQRSTEPDDNVDGAFTIGEIDKTYSNISSATALSTWPVVAPERWNVLLQALMVGSETYGVSTNVDGVPSGNAVALLDSGTSYSYCTTDAAKAIYGGVDGASFDENQGLWVLPCDAEIDMALQFGGNVYPLHPLDVNSKASSTSDSCIGTFVPQSVSIGNGQFDWLIGDNFLRSVYSMYDFGDFDSNNNMGNPYIKLLSLVDPNNASSEFVAVRGGTARSNITYNVANGSGSPGSTTLSLADSTADKLGKLVDYIPAVLGILGLNALVLLVVAGVGIAFMCRRRRRKSSKKDRASLLSLNARAPTPYPGSPGPSPAGSVGAVDLGDGHRYSRVDPDSGEPEDMPFTPPEPAFCGYDGDSLRPLPPGARPRSTFAAVGIPRDFRVSAAGSDATAFVPPSPSFKNDTTDRPKSVA